MGNLQRFQRNHDIHASASQMDMHGRVVILSDFQPVLVMETMLCRHIGNYMEIISNSTGQTPVFVWLTTAGKRRLAIAFFTPPAD
ncbi:MAG: hypothetical protein LBQ32_08815, partial [Burkholderiaceae bacterium]|nr:hypothetical protein [Burkholderiaceae bacterium]